MDDCSTETQMERYFKMARSFDENFPTEDQISNCQHTYYAPQDYYTDNTNEELNNANDSELHIGFLTFHTKVSKHLKYYCNFHVHPWSIIRNSVSQKNFNVIPLKGKK